jgi:hypothetical protein
MATAKAEGVRRLWHVINKSATLDWQTMQRHQALTDLRIAGGIKATLLGLPKEVVQDVKATWLDTTGIVACMASTHICSAITMLGHWIVYWTTVCWLLLRLVICWVCLVLWVAVCTWQTMRLHLLRSWLVIGIWIACHVVQVRHCIN